MGIRMQKLFANRVKQTKSSNESNDQRKLEESISIRKFEDRVLRSEQRFQYFNEQPNETPTPETALAHFDHYCAMVSSSDPNVVIKAITGIRYAVSSKASLPLGTLEESGALRLICNMFKDDSVPQSVIYECAWVLTNVASGASRFTQIIVREQVAPRCLDLLRRRQEFNFNVDVIEQIIWLLGNISGDNSKYNHMLVEQGMLSVLVDITNPIVDYYLANRSLPEVMANQTSFLATSTFCMGNIFRSSPFPPLEECAIVVHQLVRIMSCGEKEAAEALWGVCHAVEELSYLKAFVEAQLLPKLHHFIDRLNCEQSSKLRSDPPDFALPTIRTIGQIASQDIKDVPNVDEILLNLVNEHKLIEVCHKLLTNLKAPIVKEVLWVVSNVAASTNKKLAAEILRSNICYTIIRLMKENKKLAIKRETAWVMQNLMIQKKPIVMKYFIDIDFLNGIKSLLEEPTLQKLGMDMLSRMMAFWNDETVGLRDAMMTSHLYLFLQEVREEYFVGETLAQYQKVMDLIYEAGGYGEDQDEDDFGEDLEDLGGIEGGL
eukprot:GDKK01004514.1.p1 GENE.GDKK01004514.1~~GDKK01004514.1.p1  ORF type:complete len:547 (+),score=148.73 GDKK01004514.1:1-1641(+)